MGLRHGGRGHQVSRKVVRQRRAAGVRPKRGHNFDSRLRNERALQIQAAEAKVYDESQTAIVARLIERFGTTASLRDDMEQEIWVRLLEGETEAQITAEMRGIRASVAEVEWGHFGQISLDAPAGNGFTDGDHSTWGEIVDQAGRVLGGQAPLDLDVRWTPDARHQARAQAHLAREMERAANQVAKEAARAGREQARLQARLQVLRARELESAARACVSLIARSIGRAQRDRIRAELDAARAAFRAESGRIRALTFDWHDAHPEHGQKHREWWADNPAARQAMAEKNRRVWAMKGEEIAANLSRSGKEWWDSHPEAKAQRAEIMRQAWARRKIRERGVAA